MVFLNPLASTIKFLALFFLGQDFLFKFILMGCGRGKFERIYQFFTCTDMKEWQETTHLKI